MTAAGERDLRSDACAPVPAIDQQHIAVFIQHRPFFGDVLNLAPLLYGLRQLHPDHHLVAYTKYDGAGLLLAEGFCDELVRYKRANPRLLGDLRRRSLDLVISLRRRAMGLNFLVGSCAGAKRSLGYVGGMNACWFSQRAPYVEDCYRAVKYAKALDGLGGAVDLAGTMQSLRERGSWCKETAVGRLFVLMPAGSHNDKQWGLDHFLQVGEALLERHAGSRLLVVMGGRERELGFPSTIAASPLTDQIDMVENASVADLVRIVESADLVVGNDCGPMHVAQMLDTPLLVLFGNWDGKAHERIPAWYNPRPGALCLSTTAAAPIRTITPEQVMTGVEAVLREPRGEHPIRYC